MRREIRFAAILACAAVVLQGCLSMDDFVNVNKVPDKSNPGEVEKPTPPTPLPDQDEPSSPGGSDGVVPGLPDDDTDMDTGKVEDDKTLSLTYLSPASGDVSGGYEVRVRGTMLSSDGALYIGQMKSPTQIFVNENVVRAVIPPGKPGCVDITWVQDDEKQTLSNGFCYTESVSIASVLPSVVVAGTASEVVLTGTGFDEKTHVSLMGSDETKPLPLTSMPSNQTLIGTLPELKPGKFSLSIANANSHWMASHQLTVLPALAVDNVSPRLITDTNHRTIDVVGSGFDENVRARIGGKSIAVHAIDATHLTLDAPDLTSGCYDIFIYDDYRQKREENALCYGRADDAPKIYGVYPNFGTTQGGTSVEIIGVGLDTTQQLTFGDRETQPSLRQTTQWSAVTPSSSGAQWVTVKIGDVSKEKAFEYVVYPTANRIDPTQGNAKDTATLTGVGFDENLRVWIGGQEADVTVLSPESAQVVIPPGIGSAAIKLAQGRAEVATELSFTYAQNIEITGVSTDEVSVAGGTVVEIYGAHFEADTQVKIDGNSVEYEWLSPNCLRVTAPAHASGSVKLEILTQDGTSSAETELTYFTPDGLNTSASGGIIDGALYVTVLTVDTGEPIEGATVYVGSDVDTSLIGVTDVNGRVSFVDGNLKGSQIVIACAAEHACNTLQPVNAKNVTLFLEDWQAGSSGDSSSTPTPPTPPPSSDKNGTINPIDVTIVYTPKPAYFTGTVGDFGKVELVSNPNHIRAGMVMQSSLGTYTYSYATDDVYFLTQPGERYKIRARSGDVALALLCGIYDTETKAFYPKYIGVKRRQTVTDGAVIDNDLTCDLPLSQTQTFKMLGAPLKSGPNAVHASGFIYLGEEGYFGGFMNGSSQTDLVVLTTMPPLRGDLSDADFAVSVGAYTNGGYPATVFYAYDIKPTDGIIEVGPAAPIPIFLTPPTEDILETGKLSWKVEYPENVDFYVMTIRMYSTTHGGHLLYQFYLPGSATTAEFPKIYQWDKDGNGQIYIQLTAYKSIRNGFDFNLFSTAELRYNYIHSSAYATLSIQNPLRQQASGATQTP